MADLAIVVRESAYDRILTPLAFAYLAASSGQEVEMLFVNWAVRALSKKHADEFPISAERAGSEEWLKVIADLMPSSYLNTAMRLVAGEGAGLAEVAPHLLALGLWGAAAYIVAARTFRWY